MLQLQVTNVISNICELLGAACHHANVVFQIRIVKRIFKQIQINQGLERFFIIFLFPPCWLDMNLC